jgi:hypothetical protein
LQKDRQYQFNVGDCWKTVLEVQQSPDCQNFGAVFRHAPATNSGSEWVRWNRLFDGYNVDMKFALFRYVLNEIFAIEVA